MKNIVSITNFRNNIGTYIDHIIYKGDSILITKGNKIVAKVVTFQEPSPVKTSPLLKLNGLWDKSETDIVEKSLKAIEDTSKKDVNSSPF